MIRPPVSIVFHTERLHDTEVWKRISAVAQDCARSKSFLTFHVYPFRSLCAGHDIKPKISQLADLGHEIGQHTHFYLDDNFQPGKKQNDLSTPNIQKCISRDWEYLAAAGCKPSGFTSGGWLYNQDIANALLEKEFTYDLSTRFRQAGNKTRQLAKFSEKPELITETLVSIPTSRSLGQWFLGVGYSDTKAVNSPEIVYLHDYDLLRTSYCAMFYFIRKLLLKSHPSITAQKLAEQIKKRFIDEQFNR